MLRRHLHIRNRVIVLAFIVVALAFNSAGLGFDQVAAVLQGEAMRMGAARPLWWMGEGVAYGASGTPGQCKVRVESIDAELDQLEADLGERKQTIDQLDGFLKTVGAELETIRAQAVRGITPALREAYAAKANLQTATGERLQALVDQYNAVARAANARIAERNAAASAC